MISSRLSLMGMLYVFLTLTALAPLTIASGDYYKILNIRRDATADEVKKAYRTLALEYHPDRNKGDEDAAATKFREVSEAYQILSNDKKRKRYDSMGANWFNDGEFFNPFEQFNDLFENDPAFDEEMKKVSEEIKKVGDEMKKAFEGFGVQLKKTFDQLGEFKNVISDEPQAKHDLKREVAELQRKAAINDNLDSSFDRLNKMINDMEEAERDQLGEFKNVRDLKLEYQRKTAIKNNLDSSFDRLNKMIHDMEKAEQR